MKPVLSTLLGVTSTGDGAKQPSPLSYEGRTTPDIPSFGNPYQTYGPFQNV